MIDFYAGNELRINNTYFNNKNQQKYTWLNTQGQKSTIDYIVSNKYPPQTNTWHKMLNSSDIGSDHSLVLTKLRLELNTPTKDKPSKKVCKMKIESLYDDSTKQLYVTRLNKKIANSPIKINDDILDMSWSKLKNNILELELEGGIRH